MIRRIYTNCLPIEEYEPESPLELTFELAGTRLVVERRSIDSRVFEDDDEAPPRPPPDERSETAFATEDEARGAFDAEVAQLLPRRGVDAPAGERDDLAWVGPAWPVGDVEGWIRVDDCAIETTDDAAAPALGETDADADVLADWRLGQADPHVRARGEVSNLMATRDGAARERAKELLGAHADAWLSGTLPVATIGFLRGFVDTVLLTVIDGDPMCASGSTSARELAAFLALPIASRLRRLVLGPVGDVAISGNPYCDNTMLLHALAASGSPVRDVDLDGHVERLAPIWKLPSIERVTTRSFIMEFGDIASDSLRELRVMTGYEREVPVVTAARAPRLEAITLRTRIHDEGVLADFFSVDRAALRRLELAPQLPLDQVVAFAAAGPLVQRLEELHVAGAATSEAADALLTYAVRFAHLARFVVEGGAAFDADRAAALRRALPRIELT